MHTVPMVTSRAKLWLTLLFLSANLWAAEPVYQARFNDLSNWVVEQMPGGTVHARDGVLRIEDKRGCTVWLKQRLTAPVVIRYDAVMKKEGRISDLNCFWMASDPADPANLFHSGHKRTGAFATYDSLRTYYVGYGGNTNTTTRFRRYGGDTSRPLLPEHDLRTSDKLLQAEHTYRIEIEVRDGRTTYRRNGEVIFDFVDPQPLTEGWFGFRTVDSVIEIRNFSVERPK